MQWKAQYNKIKLQYMKQSWLEEMIQLKKESKRAIVKQYWISIYLQRHFWTCRIKYCRGCNHGSLVWNSIYLGINKSEKQERLNPEFTHLLGHLTGMESQCKSTCTIVSSHQICDRRTKCPGIAPYGVVHLHTTGSATKNATMTWN